MNVLKWVNERAPIQILLQEECGPALPLRARGVKTGVDNLQHWCYNVNMLDMGTILRKEVKASGLSIKKLSELSGVNRISLMRFMRGDTDLNLSAASLLAEFFGLELQPKQPRKRGK